MKKTSTSLIRRKVQEDALSKIAQQKRRQSKEKDDKLWPEEEKVAKLYKAGNLKFKRFQSAKDFIEDLHS
jgi:very-short-patch-repair endonuclease